jgi:molecular chaperone DnaK
VFQTEKLIKDNGDKLPEEPKARVTDAITAVNDALKGSDLTVLKTAVETLSTESQQLGAALYSQTQSEGGSADGGAATGEQADDEIVDAEIVDDTK